MKNTAQIIRQKWSDLKDQTKTTRLKLVRSEKNRKKQKKTAKQPFLNQRDIQDISTV